MYSKTPQSADYGTEQNCTTDWEIRRLRVLLYAVNKTKWCIPQCANRREAESADCGAQIARVCTLRREKIGTVGLFM